MSHSLVSRKSCSVARRHLNCTGTPSGYSCFALRPLCSTGSPAPPHSVAPRTLRCTGTSTTPLSVATRPTICTGAPSNTALVARPHSFHVRFHLSPRILVFLITFLCTALAQPSATHACQALLLRYGPIRYPSTGYLTQYPSHHPANPSFSPLNRW